MTTYTECRKTKIRKEIKIWMKEMFKVKCKINPKKTTLSKIDRANNKLNNSKDKIKH